MGYPQGDELVRVRPHPGAAGQFDDRVGREVVARALVPARTGQRDAPFRYSDLAIQALLTLKAVFDLPSQRGEGLAGSIFRSMGVRGDTAFNSGDFLK